MRINQKVNSKFIKMKQMGLMMILMRKIMKKGKFWKIKSMNMSKNKKMKIMKWMKKKMQNKRWNKIRVQKNQKNTQMNMKSQMTKRSK